MSKHPENKCLHCGLPVIEGSDFCCAGCKFVYQIIHKEGFDYFYQLKEELPEFKKQAAVSHASSYEEFDDPELQKTFLKILDENTRRIEFFLEGMHCAACVWLVERLLGALQGVELVQVNFTHSTVRVDYDSSLLKLSSIAQNLDSFGYAPHPLEGSDALEYQKREHRTLLLRIGVAAVSAGNVMMIAVSLYQGYFSGIDAKYSSFFSWISLLLALPAVLYSALPFYRTAIGGLKSGTLHIDLPITIGIVAGFVISLVNTCRGDPHLYLDSICMLIFLLLVGRLLQRQGLSKALGSNDLLYSVLPLKARKAMGEHNIQEVFSGSLLAGDRLVVPQGELFPADGTIEKNNTEVDNSFLTGESRPVEVAVGSPIFAGSRNIGREVIVTVTSAGRATRVGSVMSLLDTASAYKPKIQEITEKVSSCFVAVVIVMSVLSFSYWWLREGVMEALSVGLALLVVTCPCALGLSAPIAMAAALKKAGQKGVFFSRVDVLERLSHIKRVLFDKTGTLTEGRPMVVACVIKRRQNGLQESVWDNYADIEKSESLEPDCLEVFSAVACLESGSSHPLAQGLHRFVCKQTEVHNQNLTSQELVVREIPGKGVCGISSRDNSEWRIGSPLWLEVCVDGLSTDTKIELENITKMRLSPVVLARENEVFAVFGLGDNLREEAAAVVKELHSANIESWIVSGDHPDIVDEVGERLGIAVNQRSGALSPEDKLLKVSQSSSECTTLMIGDGVNDAVALRAADVGVGFSGGAQVCLQTADVFLAQPRLELLLLAINGAERTMQLIRFNLAFSLIYNLIGGAAAISGFLHPLLAAVLMPISSLSVIGSSMFWGTFSELKKSSS